MLDTATLVCLTLTLSVRHTYKRHNDQKTHPWEESDARVETSTEGPRHSPKQLPSVQPPVQTPSGHIGRCNIKPGTQPGKLAFAHTHSDDAGASSKFISQKVLIKSFLKNQLLHKSANVSFIVTNKKNKWTNFCGKSPLYIDFMSTFCEIEFNTHAGRWGSRDTTWHRTRKQRLSNGVSRTRFSGEERGRRGEME